MSKSILLIVEGPNDEEVLVKKLWNRFDKNTDYTSIFSEFYHSDEVTEDTRIRRDSSNGRL